MTEINEVIDLMRDSSIVLSKFNELDISKKLIDLSKEMRTGHVIKTHKDYIDELINSDDKYILSDLERISYYLSSNIEKDGEKKYGNSFKVDTVLEYKYGYYKEINNDYLKDLDDIFSGLPSDLVIPVQLGDETVKGDSAVFCKARKINDNKSILLKLNTKRHWNFDIKHKDFIWNGKKDNVVWRGASTGSNNAKKRVDFVSKYIDKYDVGLSSITKPKVGKIDDKLVKGIITLEEQLKNKFIVSLEGNDVATNLKWILSSNSVPIMPTPTKETWAMEGLLKPFYHYLPLNDDLSDLDEILRWAKDNDRQCQQIAMNGKIFMSQFENPFREMYLQRLVIMNYFVSLK